MRTICLIVMIALTGCTTMFDTRYYEAWHNLSIGSNDWAVREVMGPPLDVHSWQSASGRYSVYTYPGRYRIEFKDGKVIGWSPVHATKRSVP